MPKIIAALALSAALPALAAAQGAPVEQGPPNVPGAEPAFPQQTRAPAMEQIYDLSVETFADGLTYPWGIADLPGDAGYLVTERPGNLRLVSPEGEVGEPIAGVPEVIAESQGGMLDVVLGPDFETDRLVYLTYAKPVDGQFATAAARGRLSEDMTELTEVEDIFVQEPASPTPMHYGSRILFDEAGHVYITVGEHFSEEQRDLAQDPSALYGKVLRLNADGSIPQDNPFADGEGGHPAVWSWGHRNPQGAVMLDDQLWIIEHGPKGGDELNRIEPGTNYGWPVVSYGINYDDTEVGTGETAQEGMEQPVYYWDPVIAPAGSLVYDGEMFPEWQDDLLISSLVPGGVARLRLGEDDRVTGEARLLEDLGRVRDLLVTPEGALLVALDAEDGALMRVTPE